MVLSKNHLQYTWKPGQQQHQNKHWPPNKISFSYPQCFNVSRVHPLVRALFPTNPIPEVLLARTLKFFYSNWAKLTQDLNILNIIQGFEIPFLENPVQGKLTNPPDLNQEQSKLVKEALKEMLLKSAIQPVSSCKNQYLSNLFLASKRDRPCNRLVINLKHLNNFIPHQYFKMEGLNLLQNMLQKGDYMCNLDLKKCLLLCSSKKGIKEICMASVGRDTDTLRVSLSLLWSRSSSSNIYQNFKGTKFALEKASGSCDNVSGRYVTHVTDT